MGLFGGGGGGKSTQKTTSSSNQYTNIGPWKPQTPYILKGLGYADDAYSSSEPSQATQTSWKYGIDRATQGSPLIRQAGREVMKTLNGYYLNQENPGFQAVANQARQGADSSYAAAGRYGSGAHDTAVANAIGGLKYQDYINQLGRIDQATGFAQQLANQDYLDIEALRRIGADKEGFQFGRAGQYIPLVNGNYGQDGFVRTESEQKGTSKQKAAGGGIGDILGGLFQLGGSALSSGFI